MSFIRETVKNAAIGVGVADTPAGLTSIHHPGCAAAIWRRTPPPGFQAWIDALPPNQLPKARVVLRAERVRETIDAVFESSLVPATAESAWLAEDAEMLAVGFANIMETPYLRLRFDVIAGNACRKFHIDAVTARLICTYRGTGTQYGLSTDGEEPRKVFTVPTGSPLVLRGTRWPEEPRAGLLHRSPPIEGTGETRLLFVLDPVRDPEAEPEHQHATLH